MNPGAIMLYNRSVQHRRIDSKENEEVTRAKEEIDRLKDLHDLVVGAAI